MITYEQIQKANEALKGIDVKGKNYVMVPQRVTAFRKIFPDGFIRTKLLSLEDGVCVMQAEVGTYIDNYHNELIFATGMAYEKETSSYINKTSYIENCETSAVGRALGFLGLGIEGGGICSAEELMNAIANQEPQKPFTPPKQTAKTAVSKVNPVKKYIADEMTTMMEAFGIPDRDQMMMRFMAMRQSLIEANIIEDIDSDHQTMEQARDMIDAMYKNFKPSGEAK